MKTRCIIVDDEPIAIKVVKNHLQKFENIEIVAECKNAIKAFDILKSEKVDLMFLDIQMPEITGIDFLKTIKTPPKVIFITAYRDFALEGYELDVIDYLLKPVSFDRFLKAINKYYQYTTNEEIIINTNSETEKKNFIYIKENKRVYKVHLSDIIYIEGMKEYVRVHTLEKVYTTKNSIKNYENKLKDYNFIRIHKSFIISISKIKSFNSVSVELLNKEIPISRTYKSYVMSVLNYNEEL